MADIKVLYEDADVLVVDKPSGLLVHAASAAGGPDGRSAESTVAQWAGKNYPEMKGVGEPLTLSSGEMIERSGVVHRLDKETSGALLLAKTQDSFIYLKRQFQKRNVKKVYHTFVYDLIKDDEGVVDRSIGKSKKDFRLRIAVDTRLPAGRQARGELREATTHYKVLKRGADATYVEVCPKTGRTHQIRVHMKAINHPVVCDRLYAPKRDCLLGFERLALHARALSLRLPSGKNKTVEAPAPPDFERALARFA